MKSSYMVLKISAILLTLLPIGVARAGGSDGGGGKVVVCNYPATHGKPARTTVELYDIWEAKQLHKGWRFQKNNAPVETQIEEGLDRLQYAVEINPGTWTENHLNISGPRVKEVMRIAIDSLLKRGKFTSDGLRQDEVVVIQPGGKLELTKDSMEEVVPDGIICKPEQVIKYKENGAQILVNQTLIDRMDKLNVAGLYLHEGLYFLLRTNSNEHSSFRTRRAIAYVLSGHNFPPVDTLMSKERIICESDSGETRVDFYTNPQGGGASAYPRRIAGVRMIGFSKDYTGEGSDLENLFKYNLAPNCNAQCGGIGPISDLIDSVVDTEISWQFQNSFVLTGAHNGPSKVTLLKTRDHFNEGVSEMVTCRFEN